MSDMERKMRQDPIANEGQPETGSVKDTVRDRFSSVADRYASSTVHSQGDELQVMLELASLNGGEHVLDAGCGPGHTALTFAPHVTRVIAVDLSLAMLDQGRRLAEERGLTNIDFREGDVEELPVPDESIDRVVTRYSAHHWPSPERALREFSRVLRSPNDKPGRLLLADVVSFPDPTTDTHLQAIELLRDPSHVRDHTKEEWLEMLAAASFEARIALEWNLRLDFQSWIERMQTPEPSIKVIRSLLSAAPQEVRSNLLLEADGSFTFPCILFEAVCRS
jgi:ubiquinone/menaquinone biosynthesis C-methylase UbiE